MMRAILDLLRDTFQGLAGKIPPAAPRPIPVRIRTDDQRTPPHER
jgi:hypothetical protein